MNGKKDHIYDILRYSTYNINNLGVCMKTKDDWPKRDNLPTKDPVGDVEECSSSKNITPINNGVFDPYVEGYKQWKKDNESYEQTMSKQLKNPVGKVTYKGEGIDFVNITIEIPEIVKCNCGTEKVYGKVPLKSHSSYCALVKANT